MRKVDKKILEELLLVANIVATEFSLDEKVEVVYPISIEKVSINGELFGLVELDAMTKSHNHFMMIWFDENDAPVRARVVCNGRFVEKEIFSSEEEIGTWNVA